MEGLAVSALVWILIHRLISGGPLRGQLVARLGERTYQGAFAVLSAANLAALVVAYAGARPSGSSVSPLWLVTAVSLVQLLASVLVVTGLSTPNPTTPGMGKMVHEPDIAHGILRVTRHPFLWGVMLWSGAHLAVRHDPAALIFFGSLGLVAAIGTWSIDRKRRLAHGAGWDAYAYRTSSIPFVAIARGRQRFLVREISVVRIVIGVLMWAALLLAHPFLSGGASVLARFSFASTP
jgi:uncharacterized membrane protein